MRELLLLRSNCPGDRVHICTKCLCNGTAACAFPLMSCSKGEELMKTSYRANSWYVATAMVALECD